MTKPNKIPKGWEESHWGDISTFRYGRMPKKEIILDKGKYPIFSGYLLKGYYPEYNSDEDLIIVARGVGGTGDVKISPKKCYVTNISIISSLNNNVDKYYLYYKFLINNLRYLDTGSAQSQITIEDLKNLPILLPPLPEQKAIAAVLTSLDDKIELLREQNKVLEEIAQAVFKEWFVDQKEKFEESILEEVASIRIGRTPPRKEEKWFSTDTKDIKWISIKDLGNAGAYIQRTSEYLTKEAVDKFNIPVIPLNTVVLSFKLTIGRVAITSENMLSNEAIAQIVIKSNIDLTPEYLYLYLKQFDFNRLGSTSSIAKAINSKTIKSIPILLPGNATIQQFQHIVKPIFNKILNNQNQTTSLSKFRDSLLPKLMNGEVRVRI